MSNVPSRPFPLFLLCLCCGCWAFSFGLEFPLAARLLQDFGYSETFIGLNAAVHFLGVLSAGLFAPGWIRRSTRNAIVFGLLLTGGSVVCFPWMSTPAWWFLLRFTAGIGGAMTMIALESAINVLAAPERRSRNFAYYACAVGLGFAVGSFSGLQLYQSQPWMAFGLGGTVALLPLTMMTRLPHGALAPESSDGFVAPLQPPFLSLSSAWSQGFIEAGTIALLPIYLRTLGLSDGIIGTLLGGVLLSVLLFQLPIGWLADRFGRERVLIGCYVLVAIGLAMIPFAELGAGLAFWLCLVGICSGAFYPLGLALLGERLPDSAIPRANAWFLGINSFGSLVSPVVLGLAMDWFDRSTMFWMCEVVVLSILAVHFLKQRSTATVRTTLSFPTFNSNEQRKSA